MNTIFHEFQHLAYDFYADTCFYLNTKDIIIILESLLNTHTHTHTKEDKKVRKAARGCYS